jgi:hypothetical protein
MAAPSHLELFDAHKEDDVWQPLTNNVKRDRRLRKAPQLFASGAFVLHHDKDASAHPLTQMSFDVLTRAFIHSSLWADS